MLMSLSLLLFSRPLLPNLGFSNSTIDGITLQESNFPLVLVWNRNPRFISFLSYLMAFLRRQYAGEIIDRLLVWFLALRSLVWYYFTHVLHQAL
jgi:hypothetical protein